MTVSNVDLAATRRRISHEAALLALLREALVDDLGTTGVSGQGANNRFSIAGWDLSASQQFQFGDLRIELPRSTLVIEAESAGGVGNLVKYWPLLRSGQIKKPLLVVHVYMIGSEGDYSAHRKLWDFLAERMNEDLGSVGVQRPSQWDARLFTYRQGNSPTEVISFLKEALASQGEGRSSRA